MSDIPAATLQAYLDARVWIDLPTGGIVVSPGPLQGSAGEFPFDPAAIVHVISPEPPRAATIELPPGAAGLSAYLHELRRGGDGRRRGLSRMERRDGWTQ